MTEHASAAPGVGSVTFTKIPDGAQPLVNSSGHVWGYIVEGADNKTTASLSFAPMPYPATYDLSDFEVEDETVEESPEDDLQWEGILGFEGLATDDGRYLIPGMITERDLPLTLSAQFANDEGHRGARACGSINRIWRMPMPTLGAGVIAIMGAGRFDTGEDGREAARMVDNGTLRGVSLDLAPPSVIPIDRETGAMLDPADVSPEDVMSGRVLVGMSAAIGGATLCSLPAFGNASIQIRDDGSVLVASAGAISVIREALTASAAGLAPLAPPRDWFYTDETPGPCPLTVTRDGRVFGHLATWDQCHTGFPNACQLAPRSQTNYRLFHVGAIETAEGEQVSVGRIIVGGSDGHAPLGLNANDVQAFYDKTGAVGAFVRATDGAHGIWLSGSVRSDAPQSVVRDLRANPPSGDWRRVNGSLELIAASAVPVPGFPVPRVDYALTASANGEEEITALIAAAPVLALPSVLQVVLANAVSMYLSASGAHWDVTGSDFAEYHALFGDIYEDVQGSIDPIAENILKLGGRAPTALEQYTQMALVPAVADTGEPRGFATQLATVNDVMLTSLQQAFAMADAAGEQGIANFLAERIDMHQKWRWQLRASLGESAAEVEEPEEDAGEDVGEMSARAAMRKRAVLSSRIREKLR